MTLAATEITIELGLLIGLVGSFISIGIVYGTIRSKIKTMEQRQAKLEDHCEESVTCHQANHDAILALQEQSTAEARWRADFDDRCESWRDRCMALREQSHTDFKHAIEVFTDGINAIKVDIAEIRGDMKVMSTELKKNGKSHA
jgi:hypothetical protein